ncbi:MAG TPA: redoxin domain-containing protein [Blastocatellia bacterium]|nr:redoxin domain-containing protein [Blastocatellia bacterium]
MRYVFACLVLSFLMVSTIDVFAQLTRIEPELPRWGQVLTVVYDPAIPGAKFTINDEVYLTARLSFPGSDENLWLKMTRDGSVFKTRLNVRNNLSAVSFHFITLSDGWDEGAYLSSIVYRGDGRAARGAYESKISSRRYQEFFQHETELYPENYLAYRTKWSVVSAIDGEQIARIVNPELKRLGSVRNEGPELLCALSYGHLLLGHADKSRELIQRLFDRFPDSAYTALAIRDYESETSARGIADWTAEVPRIKLEYLRRHPETEFARAALSALAQNQRTPLDLIETIAQRWLKSEADNPQPYFNLAQAYRNQYQHQRYDQASALIQKAISLLLAGKLRLYGDLNGQKTTTMLAAAYLTDADLAFRQNRYDQAISAVRTAQSFELENDFAAHLLEAQIWQALSQETRAEVAFKEARRRGSPEAEERLKSRYQARYGNLQGFDEYLIDTDRRSRANEVGAMSKRPSPRFKVTSLDGKTFDLNALQGKIVVLDLWFVACGPCRQEIPQLNRLVREFKNRNVVFLAPALDSQESLKNFLKTLPFDYHVIPDADEMIIRKFNTRAFPTHIVIDQDGQIESMLVGGTEGRPEEVRRAVLRLLNKKV